MPQLLYLHGFRSSPQSFKARRLAAWLQANRPEVGWHCPALPPAPAAAWALIEATVASAAGSAAADTLAVVGSSLGGFYATVVAERCGCRAVLLNPAVDPARDLAAYIGEQTQFHQPEERFYFRAEYIDQLRELTPATLTQPERYAAVIAKGDELLDWREMTARYHGANIRLLEGGDHALSDFDDHLPFVLQHLRLNPP